MPLSNPAGRQLGHFRNARLCVGHVSCLLCMVVIATRIFTCPASAMRSGVVVGCLVTAPWLPWTLRLSYVEEEGSGVDESASTG